MDAEILREQLLRLCSEFGLLSAAVMSLGEERKSEIVKELSAVYRDGNRSLLSPYLLRSLARRANPFAERPWAKSFLCLAVPLDTIPELDMDIPKNPGNDFVTAAAYAAKLDYHIFCTEIAEKFVARLETVSVSSFKSEVCVDIKAAPEKILAKFAGLGDIGLNNCLVCKGSSSFFIASAFLDAELPDARTGCGELPCGSCGKCLRLCPTGALSPDDFCPEKCISYLSMEKKGELRTEERKMLGESIFGCDICTAACPNSTKSSPLKMDRKWLLNLDKKDFERIFAKSPILYARLERLKRNAEKD